MIRDPDLLLVILRFLENHQTTKFLRYSIEEIRFHLDILQRDGSIEPASGLYKLDNRTREESLVLGFTLTAKGRTIVTAQRSKKTHFGGL